VILAFWSFLGVFCGIAVLEGVSKYVEVFREKGAPLVVASFVCSTLLLKLFTLLLPPSPKSRQDPDIFKQTNHNLRFPPLDTITSNISI